MPPKNKKRAVTAKAAGKNSTTGTTTSTSSSTGTPNASGQKRKRSAQPQIYTAEKLAAQRKKMAEDYKKKRKEDQKEQEQSEPDASPPTTRPAKRHKTTPQSEQPPRKPAASSAAPKPAPTPQSATHTPPRRPSYSGGWHEPMPFQSPTLKGSGSKTKSPAAAIASVARARYRDNEDDDDDDDENEHGSAVPAPQSEGSKPAASAPPRGMPKDDNMAVTGGDGGDEDDNDSYPDDDSYEESSEDEGSEEEADDDAANIQFNHHDDVGLASMFPQNSRNLLLLILIGVVGLAFSSSRLRSRLFAFRNTKTAGHVCFRDSLHTQDKEDTVPISHLCVGDDQPILWKECPEDAYCRGGSLLKCPDGFFVDYQGCFLDATSNETLSAVLELLQKWTAEDTCQGNPERFGEYGFGGRPLFHFSRVAGELEIGYNPGLITVGNHSRFLLLSPSKDEIWIGLHPRLAVPLSFSCRTEIAFLVACSLVYGAAMMMVQVLLFFVQTFFSAFLKAPVPVGFATGFVLFLVRYAYNEYVKKANKKQFEKDAKACREVVIEILSSDPTKAFFMDDLTDKVAWRLFSMSRATRQRVTTDVMPEIARELQNHRKVKLERHVRNGLPVDKLQWVGSREDGRD